MTDVAYNWAQLAFVEKWRLDAVRGPVVGMHRPHDTTFFELRLRPGEGNVGDLQGPVDLRLIDAGNLIREKRIGLLDKVAVVVRVVASPASAPVNVPKGTFTPATSDSRRGYRLEPGSRVTGRIVRSEGDVALVDLGLPVVVQLPEGAKAPDAGQPFEFSLAEAPKGFIVV